ncbi:MAG TPA: thioredoxin domain-containing protein [Brachybacterium faecium]|nr:thioredoxin domain-containing protein [Brachybacterium faecium]
MAASGPSPSAQQRREAQREALRTQRQAELSRQRTVRTVVIAAITVVALVIAAGLGVLVYRAMQPAGPVAVPEGMSEDQPYLSFGAPEDSGKPVLEMHLDFMCPICGQFEEINGEDFQEIIESEEATVHLVPRRFLDPQSTTGDFSTRSANALACVYDESPENALTFQQLLFANQPAEGSAGLTDEEIWGYAQEAGASEEVQECMSSGTYEPWVKKVADPHGEETGGGTPYVEIDGTSFTGWQEPGALREAVLAAGGEASDGGEG